MRRPTLALASLVSITVAVIALTPARSARPKPAPCPPGRFLLSTGGPLVTGGLSVSLDAVVVDGSSRQLSIASGCLPTRAQLKTAAKGTRVKARWRTCGASRNVRLVAKIAPGCATMQGTVRAAKAPKRTFTAALSTCEDAVLDDGNQEECNAETPCPGDAPCVACRCGPAVTTTATTAPSTSSSVASTTVTSTVTSTTSPPASTVTTTTFTTTTTIATTTSSTSTTTSTTTTTIQPGTPPPDPGTLAPPAPPGGLPGFAAGTAFLRTSGTQTGADEGAVVPERAAVVRGRVLDGEGAPIPAVTVTVLHHPEFGQTLTRLDGGFDLSLNGGGMTIVGFQKAGYLPAQRSVEVPWGQFVVLPDVVLLAPSPTVTLVQPGAAAVQEAMGDPSTDADGTRRALLIVQPGTTAEMVFADGSTQALGQFHVRITEFTVGEDGPAAMPAALPASSGYTYAAEFSVDEAVAAGATSVSFSQPVIHYVENFLDFPVGLTVPAGSLDRTTSRWVPSPNGRVVRMVGVGSGRADLDLTGDGVADDPSLLGITDGERQRLAAHYTAGQELWRTPLPHFTPWDCNWPYGPRDDDDPPRRPDPRDDDKPRRDDPCKRGGSVIECQTQTLGEDVPIAGTPLSLHYRSNRVRGRLAARTIVIPLSGPTIQPRVVRIALDVTVAGRRSSFTFAPAPNLFHTFVWDGLDAYGRAVHGRQTANIRIGYVFPAVYHAPASFAAAFAAFSGVPIEGNSARQEVTLYQELRATVGGVDARHLGLGAWSLSAQHLYDANGRLYLGDGDLQEASPSGLGMQTVARVADVLSTLIAPDGRIFVYRQCNPGVIDRETGSFTRIVGNGTCASFSGDGGPALQARMSTGDSNGMALGPDGSLYLTMYTALLRLAPDGTIHRIAGNGTLRGYNGDEIPAREALVNEPRSVAVGSDGSVYFTELAGNRVRQITPDGIIHTIAGDGTQENSGDGGPARNARIFFPQGLTIGPDGSLYVTTSGRVRHIGPDGIITTVPGVGLLGSPPASAQTVAIGPDGLLYVSEPNGVRRVNADGTVERVFGRGFNVICNPSGNDGCAEGAPPLQTGAFSIRSIGFMPDARMLVFDASNSSIRLARSPFPGFAEAQTFIAAENGEEVYLFDAEGRHIQTVDAYTAMPRWLLGYDAAGRLITLTDGDGNVTTIQRLANGDPSAIVAPGGQTTTLALDADGYLETVTAPGGRTHHFTYHDGDAEGLLATAIDPRGAVHTFAYDADGRLTSDSRPARGTTTLVRTETAAGYSVAVTDGAGLTTIFGVEDQAGSVQRRTQLTPSGALFESLVAPDGSQRVTHPDGTVITLIESQDPRWGMQVPLVTSLSVDLPTGNAVTRTLARKVTLATADQPLSMTTQTDTLKVGNDTTTIAWNGTARTFTLTTPAGRAMTVGVDDVRRVTSLATAGVMPQTWTYDALGRIAQLVRGGDATTFEHDDQNRFVARTDPLGHRVELGYDPADRPISVELPEQRTWGFGWDANDNLTQVLPPGTQAHVLAYDAANDLVGHTPPGGTAASFPVDAGGRRDTVTLPGPRSEDPTFDAGGRPTGVIYDEATVAVSYAAGDTTHRPDVITRTPAGGGTAQSFDRDWNGGLPTAARFTGPAAGAFTYQYDARYRVAGTTLASAPDNVAVAQTYDTDDLRSTVGPFTITRNGPLGAPTGYSDGTGVLTYAYDDAGRIDHRTLTVNGTVVYDATVTFDDAGRIATQTETDGTGTHVSAYGWDDDGQLVSVTRDAVVAESYGYDARGNRTTRSIAGGAAEVAVVDGQDRLQSRGALGYTLDAAGFLTQRGADTFVYSIAGELLASSAGGVTYGYDGLRRRVTRTAGGGTTQYLYGNPRNDVEVTAVRDPSGTLTWYHYDDGGQLLALQRGGTRYYVATDATGSPRIVADASGNVVRRRRWDAFGNGVADTAPAFHVALGFAGGLDDPLTDLVRFGLRDYEPASGRWTSRDPVLFSGGQGNLYAYVGSHPVGVVDPVGLSSVSVGAYDFIGFDVKLTFTDKGVSACFGAGFGTGGASVSFDPFSDLDGNTASLEGGLKGQLGPGKLDLGFEISECNNVKPKVEACVGPLCTRLDKVLKGKPHAAFKDKPTSLNPADLLKSSAGTGISAKLAAKVCQEARW